MSVIARTSTWRTSAESMQWSGCPNLIFSGVLTKHSSTVILRSTWGPCRMQKELSTTIFNPALCTPKSRLNYTNSHHESYAAALYSSVWMKGGSQDFTCAGIESISTFRQAFSTEYDSATLHAEHVQLPNASLKKATHTTLKVHQHESFNIKASNLQHCTIHSWIRVLTF